MSSCNKIPSLTHLPCTRHSSRNDSSSTSNSPSLLTLFWEWDCSLVSVLSSLYSSIGITSFMRSAAPSHLPSWFSSDTTPYSHLYLTLRVSPFLPPLALSLSPGACQSLLVTKWFVGALNSAHFSFAPTRSAPFSLSLSPSNSSFFLVPVTRLIEWAALRPGNEGNGRSVKHLLFNRALLPDLCRIQEARSWTRWKTDFRGFRGSLACLPLRQWWLTCQRALHGTSVLPNRQTDLPGDCEGERLPGQRTEASGTSMSKSRTLNLEGWRAHRDGLCIAPS